MVRRMRVKEEEEKKRRAEAEQKEDGKKQSLPSPYPGPMYYPPPMPYINSIAVYNPMGFMAPRAPYGYFPGGTSMPMMRPPMGPMMGPIPGQRPMPMPELTLSSKGSRGPV